jgi:hypothetical protein
MSQLRSPIFRNGEGADPEWGGAERGLDLLHLMVQLPSDLTLEGLDQNQHTSCGRTTPFHSSRLGARLSLSRVGVSDADDWFNTSEKFQ